MKNSLKNKINKFNEKIALKATEFFGNMFTAYVFILFGFLPISIHCLRNALLYWFNAIQLWSVPLIMVGQNVQGRSQIKLMKENHEIAMRQFNLLEEQTTTLLKINKLQLEDNELLREEMKIIRRLYKENHEKLDTLIKLHKLTDQ